MKLKILKDGVGEYLFWVRFIWGRNSWGQFSWLYESWEPDWEKQGNDDASDPMPWVEREVRKCG